MYFYTAYTLSIASEHPLPDLMRSGETGEPDVTIRCGAVPADGLAGATQLGPFLWVGARALWLQVPGVARYLVENGSTITFQAEDGIDEDSIRLFLLGSCFGALLLQRGHMVLHGNAIRIGDKVMVCVGPSGAGKSTLAAGFAQRGYEVLADDVVPLDGKGLVLPGFPRIKLWADVADRLGIDTTRLDRVRPGVEKFTYPLHNDPALQPLPLRWIYVLDSHNGDAITLTPVNGMLRFAALKDNTYRQRYLDGMPIKPEHLKLCGQLATQSRVIRATRPRSAFKLDALVDTLLADMAENP